MNIIKSNFRFFKNNFLLNLLKLIFNSAGIIAAGYFYCDSVSSEFFDLQKAVIAIFITVFTCLIYAFLQGQTLKIRSREIFIRKWYGGKSKDIFLIIFTEHLIIIGVSVLISILATDILSQFSFLYPLSVISGFPGFYFSVIFHVIILIIIGVVNIAKSSTAKISDLIIKIS